MSEYEYAALFTSFLEAQNLMFANYMAFVFAMLTVSYFLAKRLNRTMTALLLFIYTLWSFNLTQSLWAVFGDFSHLGVELSKFADRADTDLGWLGPVREAENISYMENLPTIMIIMMLIVYIATIAFFFVARYQKD